MRKIKNPVIKSAFIAVAGSGTRLGRVAQTIPKPLFLLGNTPIVDFIVEELIQSKIEWIFFIVSEYNYSIFDSYCKAHTGQVTFSLIKESELRGPGYAMRHIIDASKGDCGLYLSGDRLIFNKMNTFSICYDSIKLMIDKYTNTAQNNIVLVELNSKQRQSKHIIVTKNSFNGDWITFDFINSDIKHRPYNTPDNLLSFVSCGRCLISISDLKKVDFELLSQGKKELQVMDVIAHLTNLSNSSTALCLKSLYECIDLGTWDKYLNCNHAFLREQLKIMKR